MPFTFSHPAAVLPLNYLPKRWVSPTALVIGSMTPDFEYFIRMKVSSQYSHTVKGLFWFDLPLAIILMLIYNFLVKDKLIDHLPGYFNKRFSGYKYSAESNGRPNLLVIVLCLLTGAASHILWDSFTHPTGYFVMRSHRLSHKILIAHSRVHVFDIVQHLSSLTGAVIILFAIAKMPAGKPANTGNAGLYWTAIIAIATVTVGIRMFTGLSITQYGDVIVTAISGGLIGLLIVSMITPKNQIELNA